jgi:hypothetical protein
LQRGPDQLPDTFVVDRARRTEPNVVVQTSEPTLDEASAPLPSGGIGDLQPLDDRAVCFAAGAA